MSRDESAIDLRILIRGTVTAPASGDDLGNIVTSELPDGAQCFVIENRTLYRFRKFSSLAASGTSVIAPNAGGGRWVKEGSVAGALAAFAAATDTNTTNASESGDWLAPQTGNFALQAGAGAWTFNPASCILTHTGPGGNYLCDVRASVLPAEGEAVQVVVSLNDDVSGGAFGFAEGAERSEIGANFDGGQQSVIVSAERFVTLATGDNLRPKFTYSDGSDLDIDKLTLSAIPVP